MGHTKQPKLKRIEKEYREKYDKIPNDELDRFAYMIKKYKFTKSHGMNIFDRIQSILNSKWKHVHLEIMLVPKATPRPRYNFSTGLFYVKGAQENKDIFYKYFKEYNFETIRTPCKMTCLVYLPIPNNMTNIEKVIAELGLIRPIVKPDWDNIGKTYSDMISEYLIYDDALIIEGTVKKFYSIKPRIIIDIDYMEDFDSKYNKTKMRMREKTR